MLVAVVRPNHFFDAEQQIDSVSASVDAFELRLDYWQPLDFLGLKKLCLGITLPYIFTLRKSSQGGFYQCSETERLQDILKLCELNPNFFDLEFDVSEQFLQTIHLKFPNIKLILSYHDFLKTPSNLDQLWQDLKCPEAYGYKIAVKSATSLDALRLLEFLKKNTSPKLLSVIGMGELGECTRILGPVFGNKMNYASITEDLSTAPGQLTVEKLLNIYHINRLNHSSQVLALFGDPVNKTLGHILRNQILFALEKNAIYVKLQVKITDLPEMVAACRRLLFSGFSVTMPLKEAIFPLLDKIDPSAQKIKAINTIKVSQGEWVGFNTDGKGAILALESKLNLNHFQTIVILGAGGAAKAIAAELIAKNTKVIIFNRTLEKARDLAKNLGCTGHGFDELYKLPKCEYSAIINTLPINEAEMCELMKLEYFLPNTVAMDIVYQPVITPFLQMAIKVGCDYIPGYKMYIQQALLQFNLWFQLSAHETEKIRQVMENYFKNCPPPSLNLHTAT